MTPEDTDVLIVGAGPTGLTLAAALQKGGVRHLIVDARETAQNTSRAAVVHPHTLEMLQTIGVAGPLAAEGIPLTTFTVRDRDRALLQLDFSTLPSTFQHMLMVPQSTTETVLEDRLAELGGHVIRGATASDLAIDANGAAVSLRSASGEHLIHARYVVAADGMHSAIREQVGIPFEGEAYGETFVLADVIMAWPLGPKEVSLYFSPAGLVVVAPLPDGSYRIVATMESPPEEPTLADIQRLLDARGPKARQAQVTNVLWSSRFRVHHRLAETYRKGPVLLMGDAAHVHSPAGGQGMNTGIVDAAVLGDALTRVLRGGAPDALLDQYASLRRPAAEEVLALAGRLTRIATIRSKFGRHVRNLVLQLLDHAPLFKRRLSLALSGIGRRKSSVLPGRSEVATHPKRGRRRNTAASEFINQG